ncbi:MAPEG family protein [uncultured Roseibium sp.]|uniref:MAPEG family protein n=1 Tax=uncultured Roseibium sp. TaxID=1936171 RepID=UPI002622081B|nr:MAPEG family protein [uncultured Roseibium sp.]
MNATRRCPPISLSPKQLPVLKGMITAIVICGLALSAGAVLPPANWLPDDTPGERLGFAARCILVISVWLLICIGALARHRFFTPADIDGSGLTAGTDKAKILQAVLQNTLEQTVLAALVYGSFAALAPSQWLGALPVAALLFFCGRALFWHGYVHGAGSRAFGFALTFYSTVLLFLASMFLALV